MMNGMVCYSIDLSTHLKIVSDPAGEYDGGIANATTAEDGFEGDMWGDPEVPTTAEGDSDEEEDNDTMESPTTGQPSMLPRPPRFDEDGNAFVTIVDLSGIHHLPVVFCSCDAAELALDISYLRMGLFPASFEKIQTLFTFGVLKDFRLSNLECKTSAYQYYQKLRRLTCPAFPKAVLNRYRELRRLSREYRNIKLWKMFGRAHDEPEGPHTGRTAGMVTGLPGQSERGHYAALDKGFAQTEPCEIPRGKLASFCPACPQPGINLRDDWEDDNQRYAVLRSNHLGLTVILCFRGLYTRVFTADGNFKADHLTPRNQADDVALTEGEGFMTAEGPYAAHLKDATENTAGKKNVSFVVHADVCYCSMGLMYRGGRHHKKLQYGCYDNVHSLGYLLCSTMRCPSCEQVPSSK